MRTIHLNMIRHRSRSYKNFSTHPHSNWAPLLQAIKVTTFVLISCSFIT